MPDRSDRSDRSLGSETRAREIRVGLFVVTAAVLLGVLTLWMVGLFPYGGERHHYRVAMPEAAGVSRGDRVRIAGVPSGRVERVDLRAGTSGAAGRDGETGTESLDAPVVFDVSLASGLAARQGASARLTSDGLLGSIYLEIDPGPASAAELPDGAVIHGTGEASIEEAIARAEEVAGEAVKLVASATELIDRLSERADPLLARMEDVLSPANARELSRTLVALRTTAEDAGPKLTSIAERLDRVATAAEEGTRDVPELVAQLQGVAGDLRTALGPDGRRLAETLDAARQSLDSAGEAFGTVGKSRGDLEQTLGDLRAAAAALEDLARGLEERPSRILGIGRPDERRPGDGVRRGGRAGGGRDDGGAE